MSFRNGEVFSQVTCDALGLFARAVVMSGSDAIPFRTTTSAPKFTRVVSKRAGCGAEGYESCMRNLSWVHVVDAQMLAVKDLFVKYDTDGSFKLEIDEFYALYRQFKARPTSILPEREPPLHLRERALEEEPERDEVDAARDRIRERAAAELRDIEVTLVDP